MYTCMCSVGACVSDNGLFVALSMCVVRWKRNACSCACICWAGVVAYISMYSMYSYGLRSPFFACSVSVSLWSIVVDSIECACECTWASVCVCVCMCECVFVCVRAWNVSRKWNIDINDGLILVLSDAYSPLDCTWFMFINRNAIEIQCNRNAIETRCNRNTIEMSMYSRNANHPILNSSKFIFTSITFQHLIQPGYFELTCALTNVCFSHRSTRLES